MLITQGFGWLAPFSAWWFLIPIAIIALLFILENAVQKDRKAKGKPNKVSTDEFGALGNIAMFGVVGVVFSLLFYVLACIGPHHHVVVTDFEQQFDIQYASTRLIDDERVFVGKDPDGLYVICKLGETKSSDTFKVSCDTGKNYQKEDAHGIK